MGDCVATLTTYYKILKALMSNQSKGPKEIAIEIDQQDVRIAQRDLLENLAGPVRAAVVDQDDLVALVQYPHHLGKAIVEPFDEFFLVVERHDNAAIYLLRLGGMVTYIHIQ